MYKSMHVYMCMCVFVYIYIAKRVGQCMLFRTRLREVYDICAEREYIPIYIRVFMFIYVHISENSFLCMYL